MSTCKSLLLTSALIAGAATSPRLAMSAEPEQYDPSARIAAQRSAMAPLAQLDGQWRGTATIHLPSGETRELTQTERVGGFLDGSIKVIEGRGYGADGKLEFNAFAIISFDPKSQAYNFRSYAHGQAGDFVLKPTDDGFTWDIPAGPATIRYTAVVTGDTWTETGVRMVPGQDPVPMVTLVLKRIGEGNWPAEGAVPAE